jgi:hypothetical protein
MRKARNLGTAFALSLLVAGGMVNFSSTLHAAGPGSDRSQTVRCALLQRAIDAAVAVSGADSDLATYLQGLYNANCAG